MKFSYAIFLFLISVTTLYSQEFIKHSTIHFKDSTTAQGDFYYYPRLEKSVTVVDSLGKKQIYDLAAIDYVQGKGDLYSVLDYNGTPKLFETIVKGEKASIYKTTITNSDQFYVLKDNQVTWLKGGEILFEKDGKKYRKENDHYKGILKFLLSDNTSVSDKINKLRYFESNFIPLFIAYNNGLISYVKTKEMEKQNRVSDWKVYAQYSNLHGISPTFSEYIAPRYFQAGMQYFNSEGSKHSFKFGLAYGMGNENNKSDQKWMNLNTSYYYDISRMPNGNVYFGINLLDIGLTNAEIFNDFYLLPRLSPLLGYEHHITKKTNLYVELNQLLYIIIKPTNFSFGISYDL